MMRTALQAARRHRGLAPLRDERGMLLVLSMLILLVVSTLAGANLINAFMQRSLAKNQNYASIALNAADAGIQEGIVWINDTTNAATIPTSGATVWTRPGDPGVGTLASNGTYEVRVSFKVDGEDLDCDGDTTEVVFFTRAGYDPATKTVTRPQACGNAANDGYFAFKDAFFNSPTGTDRGVPVITINSRGSYGAGGYREIEMDMARNKLNIRANGAVTAMGNVNATGNILVDGRSHDSNGNLGGTCVQSFPGVNVPAPRDLNGDGDTTDPNESYATTQSGASSTQGTPAGTGTNSQVSTSPDQALGLCDANGDGDCDDGGENANTGGAIDLMMAGLPAAGQTKVNGNITYVNITGDYDITTSGSGVLIVHNPLFEPRVWKCSIPRVPDPAFPTNANQQMPNPDLVAPPNGTSNDCFRWNAVTSSFDRPYYDAALNADYVVNRFAHEQTGAYAGPRRPRNLTGNSNVTFKGAIIADQINPINGNITIIGALISLSGVSIDVLGSGSAAVLYSCDALSLFTAQGYTTKLGWHRVR